MIVYYIAYHIIAFIALVWLSWAKCHNNSVWGANIHTTDNEKSQETRVEVDHAEIKQ